MGEIIDLDRYRRQRKRRALGSGEKGERRPRRRADTKTERGRSAAKSAESGNAEPDRRVKSDGDEQKAD
jgi:hypothetical protein